MEDGGHRLAIKICLFCFIITFVYLSVGDIAGVSHSNSDTTSSSLLASGIVSKVTGSSIAVAFEENVEGIARGYDDTYKLTKLANDVTYRRLKK